MSQEREEARGSGLWSWMSEGAQDVGYVVYRAILGMGQNNVTIMASGLVYSTLVAIVPCITFFMAFMTLFGVLQPFLDALAALFEDIFGDVLGSQIMDLIDQFSANAMSLGVFGLVSFIITATFLVNKVYNVLNQILRTQPNTGSFRRFTNFLTFLIVGVVFLAILIVFNSTMMSWVTNRLAGNEVVRSSLFSQVFNSLVSLVVAVGLLFLLYYFVPNTKVRFRSAMLGSVIAAITLMILFAVFKTLVSRMVSYSVIYGSMASIFFIFLFLYACWYIILTGAEVVYVHQFRPATSSLAGGAENPSRQIADVVNMMMLIGQCYRTGQGAASRKNITRALAITPSNLSGYINLLVAQGLIIEINDGKAASYVPSRPLDQILLCDIFDAVFGFDADEPIDTAGEAVAEQVKASSDESLANLTLENLLERI